MTKSQIGIWLVQKMAWVLIKRRAMLFVHRVKWKEIWENHIAGLNLKQRSQLKLLSVRVTSFWGQTFVIVIPTLRSNWRQQQGHQLKARENVGDSSLKLASDWSREWCEFWPSDAHCFVNRVEWKAICAMLQIWIFSNISNSEKFTSFLRQTFREQVCTNSSRGVRSC